MLKKYFLQITIFILLLGIAWALFLLRQPQPTTDNENESNTIPIFANVSQKGGDTVNSGINKDFFPIRNWMIEEPEITAKAAIIADHKTEQLKSNILYQKNADEKLPIASLTKIMTAIIAIENLNIDDVIEVSKNSIFTDGDSGGLIISEKLKVKDLLYIMLVESSNDAAMSLANDNGKVSFIDFIGLMNRRAIDLGLSNTFFDDASGLSEYNQSTAAEIVEIIKTALKYPLLANILETQKTTITSIDNKFVHNLINTNKLLGKIPGILGGKTGYTEEAGGCMLTFSKINDSYLITVILGSQNREEDTEKLINWAQTAWLWQ